jgi:hypothetical protein
MLWPKAAKRNLNQDQLPARTIQWGRNGSETRRRNSVLCQSAVCRDLAPHHLQEMTDDYATD